MLPSTKKMAKIELMTGSRRKNCKTSKSNIGLLTSSSEYTEMTRYTWPVIERPEFPCNAAATKLCYFMYATIFWNINNKLFMVHLYLNFSLERRSKQLRTRIIKKICKSCILQVMCLKSFASLHLAHLHDIIQLKVACPKILFCRS